MTAYLRPRCFLFLERSISCPATLGITEIDLALDRVVEASVFACKNHLDLELSLARQFLLSHHLLDGLLRSDTYLLEVFTMLIVAFTSTAEL